ncbi:MAG: peptidoglycan DD-metalloendopeptidase family protein [Microcystaceae cyanobacterium]
MKDEFTTKVTIIPPCLTGEPGSDSLSGLKASATFLNPSEGYRRVRRSAAMIGLAISMSASGMVLSHKATATTATENPQTSLANISSDGETQLENNQSQVPVDQAMVSGETEKLAAPSLKYQVQSGENVWHISQQFRVNPDVLTASNQLSSAATLHQGQTIAIPVSPSVQELKPLVLQPESQAPRIITAKPAIKSLIASSITGRSPSFRIKPSAVETSQDNKVVALASPNPETRVTVADVSQPIQVIPPPTDNIEQTLVPAAQEAGVNTARPIATSSAPEQVASSGLAAPIPIAVPTPEVNAIAPARKEIEVPTESNTPTSGAKLPVSLPMRRPVEEDSAFKTPDQPIAIAVIPSEAPQTVVSKAPLVTSNQVSIPEAPTVIQRVPTITAKPIYQVKAGDTLESIASDHGLKSSDLIQANQIDDPNLIKPSQSLVIPVTSPGTTAIALPTAQTNPVSFKVASAIAPVSSQPTLMSQAQAIPITVEAAPVTYTEQIKTDIARIPVNVGQPQVIAQTATNESLDEQDVNPEWKNERRLPRGYVAPSPSLEQLQRNYRPRIRNIGVDGQIIGAAPSNPQEYNDRIRIPVGQEVSPDLPPLSAPQFPNAPGQMTSYIWPAKGVLTSGFGRRWGRMHKGVDIGGPVGTPVVAAASGEVISAGWSSGGYGNLVKIRHGDGSITYYAHNSRVWVRQGQIVAQGEQIADMGSTGRSTGPHLHFEIRPDGASAINPIALLPPK